MMSSWRGSALGESYEISRAAANDAETGKLRVVASAVTVWLDTKILA